MPPHSLQLSADRYEVEIGQPIKLFLNVLGEDGKRFEKLKLKPIPKVLLTKTKTKTKNKTDMITAPL